MTTRSRLALLALASLALAPAARAADGSRVLAHDVYFTLVDKSPAAVQRLVDACRKHLSGHEGTVFFATGTRATELAREVNADGFFWDEPHYALPKGYASITGGAGDDWSCRCAFCQRMFEEQYGYAMPRQLTPEVKRFRHDRALDILETASQRIRQIRPTSKIICCVHATLGTYYVTENRGYDNWDRVAGSTACDVFSTTILSYQLPRSFFCFRHLSVPSA